MDEVRKILDGEITEYRALGVDGAINQIIDLVDVGCVLGDTLEIQAGNIEEDSFEIFIQNNFEKKANEIATSLASI